MKLIPMVNAVDMPTEVEDWCIENDVSTHYDNDVALFETKEKNPLNDWLKELGYVTKDKYTYVAVIGS